MTTSTAKEISLGKIFDTYVKITHDMPIDLYEKAITLYDKLATRRMMRTGPLAAFTLPASILLRGWAKAAGMATHKGVLSPVAIMGGLSGLGAGWFAAGQAVYAALSATAMAGVPGIITGIVAAVATAPVIMPAIALGTIAASLAAGAFGIWISAVGAAINIPVGVRRSIDYFSGNRNQTYGETFSDGPPPAPPTVILPTLSEVEEQFSMKPPVKKTAPVFNAEAATSLGADITVKKIKLKAPTAASRKL
jgi:hypothetical protein